MGSPPGGRTNKSFLKKIFASPHAGIYFRAKSEKHPLENLPHIPPDVLAGAKEELEAQYAAGKWAKRDTAGENLDKPVISSAT